MLTIISVSLISEQVQLHNERVKENQLVAEEVARIAAREALPKTEDFFRVTYADLKVQDGELVVFSDGHALVDFEGRFKVALRSREFLRHVITPEWSSWIDYGANPTGTRYRQPEKLWWWAGLPVDFEVNRAEGLLMETCWQARINDPVLGLTNLEPVCVTSATGVEK